jgi:two-component system sensor histidine kinase HydH
MPPQPPADEAGAPQPPGPPPDVILEYEPVEAARLRAYARLSLGAGLTVLPAVVIAAVALVYLVRRQRELAERVEYARRLASLGEMAAVIAHELRNPLTALKGHAQLLLRSLAGDGREEKAARVVTEAARLEAFLADLLDFSRRGEIEPAPVDPARVLRDSAAAVDRSRITVHSEAAPKSWPLDAPRIQQALSNILSNAVQVSPEGAVVDAAVFAADGALVFEVRDRGPGIPAGEEERIFEPFYTRRVRGTGLGLSLARRIVDQHHGTITARNAPDGGAVLRITLEQA